MYRVLDAAVPIALPRRILRALRSRTAFMPTKVPTQLRIRGLKSSDKAKFRLPNLEKELGWENYVDWSLYGK